MAMEIYGQRSFRDSLLIRDAKEARFFDSTSAHYSGFKAPTTLTANVTFTLPDGDGTSGQVMATNASGVLSWVSRLTTTLTSAHLFVGNGSNVATDTAITGDVTISNTGVTAIGTGKVTSTMILDGTILDADINATAAIALTKLAALTSHNRALQSDGSGFISESTVTSTELGYVSGVTSAIQTQLNGKASTALGNLATVAINTSLLPAVDNTIDLGSSSKGFANSWSNILKMSSNSQVTSLQGSSTASASVAYKLPPADGTGGFVLSTNGSGVLTWVSNASVNSFKTDWANATGASKTVTHNLGTTDIMVQLFDESDGSTIEIDSQVRTDANTLTLTASQAPATNWRVLILAI